MRPDTGDDGGAAAPPLSVVLTVDQRESRTGHDAVPELIELLAGIDSHGPFERTAGDEVQGVLRSADGLAPALEVVLRDGRWSIGIGIGAVERPLPRSPRAGRGEAFVAARAAVTTAKNAPWHLRVVGPAPVARHLESAVWLWAAVLGRRSDKGWEVADLIDEGLSYEAAGRRLGITQSAVSQRAAAAGIVEGRRARELVTALASVAVSSRTRTPTRAGSGAGTGSADEDGA